MRLLSPNRKARKRVLGEVATPADDEQIRRLLRETPMPGAVALTLEREPSFFRSAPIEGYRHESIIGRDRVTRRVVGLASRAVRTAWLNGEPAPLGYLSQLRIDRAYRRSGALVGRGFAMIRQLHEADDTPLYITTIFADNHLARIVLEKDRSYKPNYRRKGVLSSLALPTWKPQTVEPPAAVTIARASASQLDAIAACLQRNYRRYQFAPHWTADDLASDETTRDLAPEDFFVATAGGRVVGCVALWDQQSFKQTVVRGYRGWMSLVRRASNAAAPWTGWPELPDVGQPLAHAFLSHFAVDDDDLAVGRALLQSAYNAALERKLVYVVLGLDERNPFYPVARKTFRCITYRAYLYLAYYPDAEPLAQRLDDRIPHVEAAVL